MAGRIGLFLIFSNSWRLRQSNTTGKMRMAGMCEIGRETRSAGRCAVRGNRSAADIGALRPRKRTCQRWPRTSAWGKGDMRVKRSPTEAALLVPRFERFPHSIRAGEHLGALGQKEVAALKCLKLLACSRVARAKLRDTVALRKGQVLCRCFHRKQTAVGSAVCLTRSGQ
jgi:hypothetical protein